ncbi:Hypothetical predicted protein [Octopus vulgaris]|uniref:Uncharacterized protein n=1 Tax=Octopus vulgaris TaxID=6645 RepID=A0AA36F8V9_OCTVU|nr:Hypothetical predicted protein [Octopus vulgaris]
MKKYLKFLENGVTFEISIPLSFIQEYNSLDWKEYISYVCHHYCNSNHQEFEHPSTDRFIPGISYGIKEKSISYRKQTFFKDSKCHYKITVIPDSENREYSINPVDSNSLLCPEDNKTFYNDSVVAGKLVKMQELKRRNLNCERQWNKAFTTNEFGQNFIQRNYKCFKDDIVITFKTLPRNAITLYEQDFHLNSNFCKTDLDCEIVKQITFSSCLDSLDSHTYILDSSSDYYYSQSSKQQDLNMNQHLISDLKTETDNDKSIYGLTANSSKHSHFRSKFQRISSPDPKTSNGLLNNFKQLFDENELKSLSAIKNEGTDLDFSDSQNGFERTNETLLITPYSTSSRHEMPNKIFETEERSRMILSESDYLVKCPVPYCEAIFHQIKTHMSNFHSELPKWKQKFYCDISSYNKTEMNYGCRICSLCHSIQFQMKWHLTQVHNISVKSNISKYITQTSESIILTPDKFFMEAVINAFECSQFQNGGVQCKTVVSHSGYIRDFLLTLSKDENFGKLFFGKVIGSNLSALISVLCEQKEFDQQILSEQLHSLQKFFKFLHCNLDMFLPVGTSWLHQIFPSWYILELTEREIFLVACKI